MVAVRLLPWNWVYESERVGMGRNGGGLVHGAGDVGEGGGECDGGGESGAW